MICDVRNYRLPLFVKAGSIVVRNTPGNRAESTLAGPERCDVYPAPDGTAAGSWYEDDYVSTGGSGRRVQLRYDPIAKEVRREPL